MPADGPHLTNLNSNSTVSRVNSLGVTVLCSNELPEPSWDFAR